MDKGNILPSEKAGKLPTDRTSMQCTWRLKDFIYKNALPRESEEETIWRVLGMKTLTKEQIQTIKSNYEKFLESSQ